MGLGHSPTIITDGLVFSLDAANRRSYSGTGNTAFELIGGINGTLVNGVGFSSTNNGYFSFDGSNDYIDFPLGTSFNTLSSFTIELIGNTTTTNKKQALVSTYDNNLGYGLEVLDNTGSNKFNFFVFTSAGIYTSVSSTASVSINQTYNLSCVFTGSNSIAIFLNGTLDNSVGTNYSSGSKASGSNLRLGDDPNSQSVYLQGNLGLLRFYNKALSATEIKQNYNATKRRFGF
jgi:hypothetical protein